jgi:diguanylate cyclase (GGDEF)-like protein/PAS domain S-box-containing protein
LVPVPPDLVVAHTQDVTESWLAEQKLRVSEERYRTIVENAQEGIGILDAAGHFTFANRRTAELLGYDVGTLIGMDVDALLSAPSAGSARGADRGGTTQYEASTVRPDGSHLVLLVSTAPVVLSGSLDVGSLCMMSDVTGLRRAEEELAHWALHDGLTGLPNRALLTDRIDQALARSGRHPGTVAVLLCDLDDFKTVNDSLGHRAGDEVLRVVAARLRSAVRPADTVARIGADEFVILCEGLDGEAAAFGLADAVLGALRPPLQVNDHELSVGTSIGVAFAASAASADLLRNAAAAMQLAKQRGRNRAELFNEQHRQLSIDRVHLIADLRHSVARGELRMHYQPVLSLDGENLLGVEALVRWQHPERGLIFPDEFIPAAEGANLIGEIGAWVLEHSCRQAALWRHAGVDGAPLHMAVNVSAQQLEQGSGLVELVTDVLRDAGIDPHTLVLEVTESAVMDDAEGALTTLTELKELGIQLAIDDFGTGYSSLVYLKRFPVDLLKVDRTFVSGLGTDPDDSAIVASVIGLAHAVGVAAVAEGVETGQQLAALQRLGCTFGQGYLWSRPCSADDIDQIIGSGPSSLRTADLGASRSSPTPG